ncbi:hypothetical protein [Bacillus sp. FSL K6-3431]
MKIVPGEWLAMSKSERSIAIFVGLVKSLPLSVKLAVKRDLDSGN